MAYKTGAKRHTHRYYRLAGRWACSLPDCSHYLPGNVADSIVGKESICWDCGKKFLLDEVALKKDAPICPTCDNDSAANKLAELLRAKGL
jgi:hypothetical protein